MFHFIEAAVSDGEEKDQDTMEDKDKSDKKDPNPRPRALHKTSSIFLRNLAPSITKQEVEAVSVRIRISIIRVLLGMF